MELHNKELEDQALDLLHALEIALEGLKVKRDYEHVPVLLDQIEAKIDLIERAKQTVNSWAIKLDRSVPSSSF